MLQYYINIFIPSQASRPPPGHVFWILLGIGEQANMMSKEKDEYNENYSQKFSTLLICGHGEREGERAIERGERER